jgi:hypothetical protein
MGDHIIGDLANVEWLLWQATLSWRALIPLVVVCLWSAVQARRSWSAMFTLVLPFFWFLPIALAGAFTDWRVQEAKTASWVGEAALLSAALQIGMSGHLD